MPKPRKKQIKPIATATIYHCKDCAKSYDWHSKALDTATLSYVVAHTSRKVVAIVYFLMTHNVSILN